MPTAMSNFNKNTSTLEPADRSKYCPNDNERVCPADPNAIYVDGQWYHKHHLLKPKARSNGCKEIFEKFEQRFEVLRAIPFKSQELIIEFRDLKEVLGK